MVKICIKLGEFNKKLILPFCLALTHLILILLGDIIKEDYKSHILESSAKGLGKLAVLIIPHIKFFSISNQKEKTKCKCSKQTFKHYFILLFFFALESNAIYFSNILNGSEFEVSKKSIFLMKTEELSTKEGIEIILITIVSILLLKYKYFNHHLLSIIFFCFEYCIRFYNKKLLYFL